MVAVAIGLHVVDQLMVTAHTVEAHHAVVENKNTVIKALNNKGRVKTRPLFMSHQSMIHSATIGLAD